MMRTPALLACAAVVSGSVFATAQPTPATRPSATDAGRTLDRMRGPAPAGGQPVAPPAGPAPIDATSGHAATAPAAPPVTVMREGTLVVDRTGRLARSADGSQWEFAFDADGQSLRDPPVVLLPNLKLMAMETQAASATRDLRFRITGVVTEYKSRNYVLLEKVVVVSETTSRF